MSGSHPARKTRFKANVVWNLAGQLLPILVAVASVPFLIRAIGTERFGVLTLVWAVVGYFSFFDLGLSRALTQLISERIGTGRTEQISDIIWAALVVLGGVGVLAGGAAAAVSPLLVESVLKIPAAYREEALVAFWVLGISIPTSILSTGLIGVLAAYERFDLVNAIKMPLGIVTYVGPLLIARYSHDLVSMVVVVCGGRVLAALILLWLCTRICGIRPRPVSFSSPHVRALLRFGSWTMISNIVAPLFAYFDRFAIGALVSVAAVAYYATPYDMITKLWIISTSVVGAVFPLFARSAGREGAEASQLYGRAIKLIYVSIAPLCLFFITMSSEVLDLWLGHEFAARGSRVLQWLAIGVFLNCVGHVPSGFIQGIGRPDITAKLHLIEVPLYVGAALLLIRAYGIEGAALAWAGRAALDTFALLLVASRHVVGVGRQSFAVVFQLTVALVIFGLVAAHLAALPRGIMCALGLAGFVLVTWRRLLTAEERRILLGRAEHIDYAA